MSGYDVVAVASAGEAKSIIGQEEFRLVLLDLVMPEEDGQSFLQWLRQQAGYNQPIIMITSVTDANIIEQLKESGATEVLAKPVRLDTLNATINQYL
jgi:CitB family two-component system response regulator MalR